MLDLDKLREFVAHVMGCDIEQTRPVPFAGWEVAEALWPLNDVLRPRLHQIRSLPYDPRYEAEADDAIARFAWSPDASVWQSTSGLAMRVVLERHIQALMVAVLNASREQPVMWVPSGFPPEQLLGFSMLSMMFRMELAFPVEDRGNYNLSENSMPGSLSIN